jgi:hypothetical protein
MNSGVPKEKSFTSAIRMVNIAFFLRKKMGRYN